MSLHTMKDYGTSSKATLVMYLYSILPPPLFILRLKILSSLLRCTVAKKDLLLWVLIGLEVHNVAFHYQFIYQCHFGKVVIR